MLKKLLIANRGEIAIRIARTAADMGIETLMVFSADDAASLHVKAGDGAAALAGAGPAAYLDRAQIIAAAREAGCDAVHPGYGFLSENAAFARACGEAGLIFVGPSPGALEVFGDKVKARALAESVGVPVLPGSIGAVSLADAERFLASLGDGGAVMLKALAGGGGRGMRPVHRVEDMAAAYERCQSEALQAFGNGEVYVERFFPLARHVEVQVIGDGAEAPLWSTRNSTVPRLRYRAALARATALSSSSARRSSDTPTAGATSITFCRWRWALHSRSQACTTTPPSPMICTSTWRAFGKKRST